jgi:hypothetical protein
MLFKLLYMVDSSSFLKTNIFEFANSVLFLFCMSLFSSYRPIKGVI